MKLRSGKNMYDNGMKECKHSCELWQNKCCACSDKRSTKDKYYAYNQSYVGIVSTVSRDFYYCPSCKTRKDTVRKIVPNDVNPSAEQLKKKIDDQNESIVSLNKTIAIYETRMAKMESDNKTLMERIYEYENKETEEEEEEEEETDDYKEGERRMNLYFSGLNMLIYHLAYSTDVMRDWI